MKSSIPTLILSLLMVGCPVDNGPVSPKPAPDSDMVDAMCTHLQKLGCEEGDPVYNDDLPGPVDVPNQECGDFYRGLQEDGFAVNPRCVRLVTSCGAIEDYRALDPDDC